MRPQGLAAPILVLVVFLYLTCRCLSLTGIYRLRHHYNPGIGGIILSGNVHRIGSAGAPRMVKANSRISRRWGRLKALPLSTFDDFIDERRHCGTEFVLWMKGGDEDFPTKRDAGQTDTAEKGNANEEYSKNEIAAGDVSEESEKTEGEQDPNAELNAVIKELERKLKKADKELDTAKINILNRGKTGYLKLVARVDNYRKQKDEDRQRQHNDATASVLRFFLPILDAFETSANELLANTEEEDQIISNYGVIFREIMTTFKKLGMVEYSAHDGSYFQDGIHSKVGEEYNDTITRNRIIKGIKPGFKVHEIIIRPAECVVCLGKEPMDEQKDIANDETAGGGENSVKADVE